MLDAFVSALGFSIFGFKSAEMAITLAGMLSVDQKMSLAKDILAKSSKNNLKIARFCYFCHILDKNIPKMPFPVLKVS